METKQLSEIQRIATVLGIDYNNSNLCLKIQGKIKELMQENKKLSTINKIISYKLNNKNKQLESSEVKMTDFQYIKQIDKLYLALKEENKELNGVIYGLKQENNYYIEKIKELKKNN